MTTDEYQENIKKFFLLASMVEGVLPEAKEILKAIEYSESMGPMLDPTAWIRNHKKMAEDKALVEAVVAFGTKFEQLKAKAKEQANAKAI